MSQQNHAQVLVADFRLRRLVGAARVELDEAERGCGVCESIEYPALRELIQRYEDLLARGVA